MKTTLSAVLLAAAFLFAPVASLTATSASASTCGVDAPAGWERPGGFCDQRSNLSSQSTPVETFTPTPTLAPPEEEIVLDPCVGLRLLIKLQTGERVRIAGC